jgi:hypothetical protein
MILDNLLNFCGGAVAPGNNDGRNDVPTTGTQSSSNIIDLGIGFANPGNLNGIAIPGNAAGGGARDIGIGDDPAMKLVVQVITGFAGGTSLQINIQGAPDNGSGAPGAFTIMAAGPVVALAQLISGVRLMDMDMPRPVPNQPLPRFLQLGYVNVGTFTGGLQRIQGYLVLDRVDQINQLSGAFGSGYPPGIAIAN